MDADVQDRGSSAKEFICSHVKTIVTVFMIFGTISVIVLIVMGEYFSIFAFVSDFAEVISVIGSGPDVESHSISKIPLETDRKELGINWRILHFWAKLAA